jgi:predicted AAA+ superfamily ATPase
MRRDRHLIGQLQAALSDTRVVYVTGPRQCGKTVFVQQVIEKGFPASYLTLDDLAVLSAAQKDPAGFIAGLERPVVIDEVQRAPELFLPIKYTVDRDPRPGQFLLTGSSHVLSLPKLADSLAGRMEILYLHPFSESEIDGIESIFLDLMFQEGSLQPGVATPKDVVERAMRGGYPEAVERVNTERRDAWFRSYIHAIVERDLRDLAEIERLSEVPQILQVIAAYACGLVNYAQIARDVAMPQTTLKRYISLLESVFLVETLPAYHKSLVSRLIKAPKLYLNDTGLMSYLLGQDNLKQSRYRGALIETFVLQELKKQASFSLRKPEFTHYRTASGLEVDIVLEANNDVVGVEVKASATVGPNDFKGLHHLRNETGSRFRRGVVLYLGEEVVPFDRNLHAVPLSRLWTMQAFKRTA